MRIIEGFTEEPYTFMSNMYILPQPIFTLYHSSENFYMAMKTEDKGERIVISKLTPAKSKRYAKTLELREDWEDIKVEVMRAALNMKFRIPELKEKLLATEFAYLEETNWWNDTFWGVCKGEGENMLGKLLMQVREEVRQEGMWG
jgi:hypothetical protein